MTFSRTYTFSDGTTAYGSQVETEIGALVNGLNNLDAGTSTWAYVKASTQLIGKGTATNDDAAAGYIGEELISTRARTSVSLTTATPANILSSALSLTAGDWDICGTVVFTPTGTTTFVSLIAAFSKTSATLPTGTPYGTPTSGEVTAIMGFPPTFVPGNDWTLSIPPMRVTLSVTTSYYLVGQSAFGTSTLTAGGHLRARRIR